MKISTMGGVKTTAGACHRKPDGTLIWQAHTREGLTAKLLSDWDAWRVGYCSRNRDKVLPRGLREGKASLILLIRSEIMKRRDKNGVKPIACSMN